MTTGIARDAVCALVLTAAAALALGAARPAAGGGPAKPAKPPQADIAEGRRLFLQSCALCHGTDAGGGEGPDIRRRGLPAATIARTVHNGIKGQMPAFGQHLTKTEENEVLGYIRALQ